jgi:N-acetylglucosamine malate deacetylase 2
MKKILAVFAHPDDETFGPGATLAKYASQGVQVDVLMATRGEAGENHLSDKTEQTLGEIREKELRNAEKVLGVHRLEFLDFIDGELRQNIYFDIANKIITKIKAFKPDVMITFEPHGVSGHLDHIAMSFITTYAYQQTDIPKKLYYTCLSEKTLALRGQKYFIYFPEGYADSEITTRIDVSGSWDTKLKALMEHKSQLKDVKRQLQFYEQIPKVDNFILKYHRLDAITLPESDIFNGIVS